MGFDIPQKYGDVIIKLHLVPACWGRLGAPQSSGWLESGHSFRCRTKTVTLPGKSSFVFDAVDDRVASRGQHAHQFNLKLTSAMADRWQDFILNLSFAKLEHNNNLIWTGVLVVALCRTWLEHWKNRNWTWTQRFTKKDSQKAHYMRKRERHTFTFLFFLCFKMLHERSQSRQKQSNIRNRFIKLCSINLCSCIALVQAQSSPTDSNTFKQTQLASVIYLSKQFRDGIRRKLPKKKKKSLRQ